MSPILLAGVFAGTAAGVDLFLTVGLLSALALAGVPPPHIGLADLASLWLLLPTLAMYLAEAVLERRPGPNLIWRQLCLIVRPVGAATLGVLLMAGEESAMVVQVALLAAVLALAAHVVRSGWAFLAGIGAKARSLGRGLLLEDFFVVALVIAWWLWPPGFWTLVAVAAALVVVRGRGLISAFMLSSRLVLAGIRSLVRAPGWLTPRQFPSWMKHRLAPTGVVTGGRLRGTPAACVGLPRPGAVSRGWLVVRGRAPTFVRPTRGSVESVELEPASGTRSYEGPLCYCVRISGPEARPLWIVVPRDGPDPRKLAFELH
jgi:hypothetical protein